MPETSEELTNNPLLARGRLPNFSSIEAAHVAPAVREVLRTGRDLVAQLARTEKPTIDWLTAMEWVHERIHRVWGPVAHLNNVVSSSELRDAFNECLPLITEFSSELGQNEALYRQFLQLERTLASDTAAASELVRQGLRDFRLAGVALDSDSRKRFRALMLKLSTRQAEFEQNLMDATDAFSHRETDSSAIAGLPESLLESTAAAAAAANLQGWLFKLNPPTYQSVMTHAESSELRELFYRAWTARASDIDPVASQWDNSALIEDILALRHEAAEILGFNNFAELSLATKMAPSVDDVIGFLEDLTKRSKAVAADELESLEEFAGTTLAPWDVTFYAEKLKKEQFQIGEEELRAYFPLPQVLGGMFALAERLFGLAITKADSESLWHPSVEYFRIADKDGKPIGGLLCDFFARPNKRGGAWMDACENRLRLGSNTQDPVAYLACNFAEASANEPSYLTHNDVLTLFHEFGHALHHLLTEIDYPSLAGINGVAWDAVELPSQFLENYAWQPDVLKGLSKHRVTGEPIPSDKIELLTQSRTFLAGMAMLRQIEFALFDFRLHTEITAPNRERVQQIIDTVRSQVAVVPAPDFNRFQCSFSHVFGGEYAAGYYSYKWAEVLAADAFSAFEEAGTFDQDTALRFQKSILAVGGSRDALDAFVDFRGRPPALEALLAQAGIAP